MGIIYSAIHTLYLNLRAVFQTFSDLNTEFSAALARINTSPGLPVPNPTSSFWQEDPPFPELVDIKSPILPSTADIVIIGSGISGTSIAWTLLHQMSALGINRRIVMLEARQLCSGATGRNGGHIKTEPHGEFATLKKRFGAERAAKIIRFKKKHVDVLTELAEKQGIDTAEGRKVETVDLHFDKQMFEKRKVCVADLEKHIPEMAKDYKIWEGVEATKQFSTSSHIIGAISYPSGAIFPYRLVASLLKALVSKHTSFISVETHTPVTHISIPYPTPSADPLRPYTVHTPRGEIHTTHIIHATNAHAAHLLPGIVGKLFPIRGHVSAQVPGTLLPIPYPPGSRSWSFAYREGYDYVTQLARPGSSAFIIAGGGHIQSTTRGMNLLGDPSDAELDFHSTVHLNGILPMVFGIDNWGPDAPEGRVKSIWSGSLGFTADAMPFVGRLEESLTGRKVSSSMRSVTDSASTPPGEFITAGYCGEGMVSAWLCGVALALMVLEKEDEGISNLEPGFGFVEGPVRAWFPEDYIVTAKRVRESNVVNLLEWL